MIHLSLNKNLIIMCEKKDKLFLFKIKVDFLVYLRLIAQSRPPPPPFSSFPSLENQIVKGKLISLSRFYSVMIKVVKPLFILLSHENGGSIDLADLFFFF